MLPIILCLFEGLNDLRLVYNDCEKIYFITFVKVRVAIYNDHTVVGRIPYQAFFCTFEEKLKAKKKPNTWFITTVWSL